jgi:carbonic anhydrase
MKFNIKSIVILTLTILALGVVLTQGNEEEDSSVLGFFNNMYSKGNHEKKLSKSKFNSKARSFRFSSRNNNEESLSTYSRFLQTTQNTTALPAGNSSDTSGGALDPNAVMEEFLKISSPDFSNKDRYPDVVLPGTNKFQEVKSNIESFRINAMNTTATPQKPDLFFYFRMNKDHIYYASDKLDLNVLGALDLNNVKEASRNKNEDNCFDIVMKNDVDFKICSKDNPDSTDSSKIRDKWYCGVITRVEWLEDIFCSPNNLAVFKPTFAVENHVFTPIIMIPESSPVCNHNFNFLKRGSDWECICKEGKEQSPISIPSMDVVLVSPAAPVFSFEDTQSVSPLSSLEGLMTQNEKIKVKYFEGAIRIFNTYFGKLVTLDGTVYYAEEIVFHTPSQHMINGVRGDMEMQVICYGQSKGDIAKQAVVSFIFEKKAGAYNKFIDDVDFFDLPNHDNPEKDVKHNLYIPKVLYPADSNEMVVMRPISLYTYQGSITFPPCTERTIHYVHADMLPIAHSMIQLLKEAVRHNSNQGESELENVREVQPLNGRSVFFYDASMCKPVVSPSPPAQPVGHFERLKRKITQFFFVNGEAPSGLPDSYLVSENEAKGIKDPNIKNKDQ